MSNSLDNGSSEKGVNLRFFGVGCVLLLAALGLAAWGFGLGCLSASQGQILQWLLPLASGFGAGAFVGSLNVTSPRWSFLSGLAVTATGGFGVWLITVHFLAPVSADGECGRNATEQKILDYRAEIQAEAGNWERAKKDVPPLRETVRTTSWKSAEAILQLPTSDLNNSYQLTRLAYGSAGYLYSGLAGDLLEAPKEEIVENAENSRKSARACYALIERWRMAASSSNDASHLAIGTAYKWALDNDIAEYCRYVELLALALLTKHQYSSEHLSDMADVLHAIKKSYIATYQPATEDVFRCVCKEHHDVLKEAKCDI